MELISTNHTSYLPAHSGEGVCQGREGERGLDDTIMEGRRLQGNCQQCSRVVQQGRLHNAHGIPELLHGLAYLVLDGGEFPHMWVGVAPPWVH